MNRMVQTRISLTNSTRPASMRLDTASGRCARSTASALSTTSRLMQGGCDPRPAAGMTVLTACNGSLQARGNSLEPLAISVTDVNIAGNLQLHYVHPILARKDKLHCCTDLGAGEFSGIADVKHGRSMQLHLRRVFKRQQPVARPWQGVHLPHAVHLQKPPVSLPACAMGGIQCMAALLIARSLRICTGFVRWQRQMTCLACCATSLLTAASPASRKCSIEEI